MSNNTVISWAEVLWDYSKLHHQPSRSDVLTVLGCGDTTIPAHVLNAYHSLVRLGFTQQLLDPNIVKSNQ